MRRLWIAALFMTLTSAFTASPSGLAQTSTEPTNPLIA